MRKMRDSGIAWIGEIPSLWSIPSVKYCFNIECGATPKSGNSSYWDGDIPWITPSDFSTGDYYVSYGERSITQEGYDSCGTVMVPPNSIILTCRAPIGTVAISKNRLCTNQGCKSLVPHNNVHPKYGYYYFVAVNERLNDLGRGTTFIELSTRALQDMEFLYPSYKEQCLISDYLDSKCFQIDEAIRRQESIIEKLKEYRQSVITEAVTKGLDPNAEMKNSGLDWIGMIPESYRVGRIKNWYSVTLGKMVSPNKTEDSQTLENYLCAANIQWEGIDFSVQKKMYLTPKEKQSYLLSPGDVLVSEGGSVGTTCMYNGEIAPCYIQNSVHRVASISSEALNRYIYYWFHIVSSSGYLDNICNKATFSHYTKEKVTNTPLILPPVSVQKKIVSYLDIKCSQIDEAIRRQESIIKKLKAYRQSIIYEAVTGKREVV